MAAVIILDGYEKVKWYLSELGKKEYPSEEKGYGILQKTAGSEQFYLKWSEVPDDDHLSYTPNKVIGADGEEIALCRVSNDGGMKLFLGNPESIQCNALSYCGEKSFSVKNIKVIS